MILLEFIGMNITHNFATIGFGHMPFPKECLNASVQDRMQWYSNLHRHCGNNVFVILSRYLTK